MTAQSALRDCRADLARLQRQTEKQLDAIMARLNGVADGFEFDPRYERLEDTCAEVDGIRAAFLEAIEAVVRAERIASDQLDLFGC